MEENKTQNMMPLIEQNMIATHVKAKSFEPIGKLNNMKYNYNKLIRDYTLDKITEEGDRCVSYKVIKDDKQYEKSLVDKLYEEIQEVVWALNEENKENLVEEIADVYTVLEAILNLHSKDIGDLESAYYAKAASLGRFARRIYLISTS